MKHLRLFKTNADYESTELVKPNVSYVEENKVVFYIPKSEEPAVAPVGASIYGLDGKFYSVEEWTASGKSIDDVVGVAVSDGEHSFVVHPTILYEYETEGEEYPWFVGDNNFLVDGITTTTSKTEAEKDFAGEANTAVMIAFNSSIQGYDLYAAQKCYETIFSNEKRGYLPSAGELTLMMQYYLEIRNLIRACGGYWNWGGMAFWSSTQYNETCAWMWDNSDDMYGGEDSIWYDDGYIGLDYMSKEFTETDGFGVNIIPITSL